MQTRTTVISRAIVNKWMRHAVPHVEQVYSWKPRLMFQWFRATLGGSRLFSCRVWGVLMCKNGRFKVDGFVLIVLVSLLGCFGNVLVFVMCFLDVYGIWLWVSLQSIVNWKMFIATGLWYMTQFQLHNPQCSCERVHCMMPRANRDSKSISVY